MTAGELGALVRSYRTGLEAELVLLRQLQGIAATQHEATEQRSADLLARVADQREGLMANLVAIEHQIKPARELLATHHTEAAAIEGFADVVSLHRSAADLVGAILAADEQTRRALRAAEAARRQAAEMLEAGEASLAAYRRVIAPPLASASLFNRRG